MGAKKKYKVNEEVEYYVEPDLMKDNHAGPYEVFLQEAEPSTLCAYAHLHNCIELIYVKEGTFTAYLGEYEFNIAEGDLLLIRSGEIHRIYSGEEEKNSYYVLKIDPVFFFSLADDINAAKYVLSLKLCKRKKSLWKKDEIACCKLKDTIEMIVSEHFNPTWGGDIVTRCAFGRLLYEVLKQTRWDNPEPLNAAAEETVSIIYRAIELMNKKFTTDINARDVSRTVGLSYSYFSRMFSEVTGITYCEYLTQLRINYSKKLLLTTDKRISDIAYESGYHDTAYFIATFRRYNGVAPTKYRHQNQK